MTSRLLGPLAPVLRAVAVIMVALTASRLVLVWVWWPRVHDAARLWEVVPIGVRVDAMTLGWLTLPLAATLVCWPARIGTVPARVAGGYLALVAGTLAFFEAATYPFLVEYDARPNRVFLDYLVYPREVFGTVWAEHAVAVVLGFTAVGLVAWWAARTHAAIAAAGASWSWWQRAVAGPVALGMLFLVARSGLGPRGGNISTAAFSENRLVNELALDSTYAVGYALASRAAHEVDTERLYGRLDRGEAITRVRAGMLLPPSAFPRDDIPFLHHQASHTPRARPLNLVIVLEESLGAGFVGALGGMPLTPNLDALSQEGLFFTNLFATGTRTVRGIEATVCGFLPTPASGVVKLGLAQADFFTAAALLRRHGYATEFIYGGESNFDNMRGFFLNNGFERVIDEPTFATPVFRGIWGVSDEDLVRRANDTFVAHGRRPFFAVVLSTSNHSPFEFPAGRIQLFEQPANTVHNAIKYADHAIGELFRLAKQEEYWADTLFVVVADHDRRVWGKDLVPVNHFRIPALVIGPGVPAARHDGVASQVDLLPTLLDLMGLDVETPLMGRDLMAVPASEPGHAFMQYDLANGYRVGDDVVVLEPYKKPQTFRFEQGRLRPAALDPERVRDAIAHVQVPSVLYRERRYRLPIDGGQARR